MLVRKEWQINPAVPEQGTILERVLAARGVTSESRTRLFFHGDLSDLHDPFSLPDMAKACVLLANARHLGQTVLIHGDYDVDGVAATALMKLTLQQWGIECKTLIPARLTDGYGLSENSVSQVLTSGCDLLLTVDCGISSWHEVSQIRDAGMEVIITDHHECPKLLPPASAVINPKRPDSRYPFSELAGVGVACKLLQAFAVSECLEPLWQKNLDLVALATIADVVPLQDENRIFVRHGLEQMNRQPRCGLEALMNAVQISQRQITAQTVGFILAPRLNAAGRLDDADLSLRLLLTSNANEAADLAETLNQLNQQRQKYEAELVEEAKASIEAEPDWSDKPIHVVARDDWHPGVLGIVAARLAEHYCCPVIVLSGDEDGYQGSGRSWGSFNLIEVLRAADNTLIKYGGHQKAAGLRLAKERLQEFIDVVETTAVALFDSDQQHPVLNADLILPSAELSFDLAREIELLAPFGEQNPQPVWIVQGLTLAGLQPAGNGRHLRLELLCPLSGKRYRAIAFGLGEADELFSVGDVVDLLFSLEINVWQGNEKLQLNVKDIRPGLTGRPFIDRPWDADDLYQKQPDIRQIASDFGISPQQLIPTPAEYKAVYQYMRAKFEKKAVLLDLSLLARRISRSYRLDLNMFRLSRILSVFTETGLVEMKRLGSDRVHLVLCSVSSKVRLEASPSYRRLQLEGSE